jgi:hypothetical protein
MSLFLQFLVSVELQPLTINSSNAVKHRKPSSNETNFWQQLISIDSSAMRSPSHYGRTSKPEQWSISLHSMLRYLTASCNTCNLWQNSMVRSSSFGVCCSKFSSFEHACRHQVPRLSCCALHAQWSPRGTRRCSMYTWCLVGCIALLKIMFIASVTCISGLARSGTWCHVTLGTCMAGRWPPYVWRHLLFFKFCVLYCFDC